MARSLQTPRSDSHFSAGSMSCSTDQNAIIGHSAASSAWGRRHRAAHGLVTGRPCPNLITRFEAAVAASTSGSQRELHAGYSARGLCICLQLMCHRCEASRQHNIVSGEQTSGYDVILERSRLRNSSTCLCCSSRMWHGAQSARPLPKPLSRGSSAAHGVSIASCCILSSALLLPL